MNSPEVKALVTGIKNLLRERDFMGYQLSYEGGSISQEQFDQITAEYLETPPSYTTETVSELTSNVLVCIGLLGDLIDIEVVATLFNCELDVARKAFTDAVKLLK